MNTPGQFLFAVWDGHGIYGHDIANFVKKTLPNNIVLYQASYINPTTQVPNDTENFLRR